LKYFHQIRIIIRYKVDKSKIVISYFVVFLSSQLNQKTKAVTMPKGSGLTKPMKLSADLADIVGKKEASRAECIKQLWAYIKKNNLQDPENKQFFTPDKKMAKVFGSDRIRAFGMAKFLSSHLQG
jgi:upstream activation factor subunit UAF30